MYIKVLVLNHRKTSLLGKFEFRLQTNLCFAIKILAVKRTRSRGSGTNILDFRTIR